MDFPSRKKIEVEYFTGEILVVDETEILPMAFD